MNQRPVPPQHGDERELFERYDRRLHRVTSYSIRTSSEIVDDACAFAWMTLLTHQPRRETVWPWLRTVARNEALRLKGLARSHAPLATGYFDDASDERLAPEPPGQRRTAEMTQGLLELRERLAALPRREREAVFLHAAGWRYVDVAERLGISYTRVNQLLVRASERMRAMDVAEHEVDSPRGRHLQELERRPPPYLVASIGRPPSFDSRRGRERIRVEWKRLALAIEDYRAAHGITDRVRPLGTDDWADLARESLARSIADFRKDRGLSRALEL